MLYKSRESRPEDLEKIRELQREVKQQQHRLRELEVTTHTSKQTRDLSVGCIQAEKQVYQLELVNREKNYNKLFSASPCVGVLDPLASSKVCP